MLISGLICNKLNSESFKKKWRDIYFETSYFTSLNKLSKRWWINTWQIRARLSHKIDFQRLKWFCFLILQQCEPKTFVFSETSWSTELFRTNSCGKYRAWAGRNKTLFRKQLLHHVPASTRMINKCDIKCYLPESLLSY